MHFLGLVDIYIALGQPDVYEVEPQVSDDYRPDAYTRLDGVPTIIEYQRSIVSTKKMISKVEQFVSTYHRGKHDAKRLLIISETKYNIPSYLGFHIEQKPLTELG